MKSVSTDSNRVVSFGEKVSYGITEIACNPMYTIFCSFLVFFYTDVIGVNAAAVGTIILISRIFDGFSDIIAGNIVEHTHAKSGSARPWILRIAIPLGISYIAMFTVPDCGEWGKLIYIFVSYNVIQSVVYTMANAAMSALPTYMTNDRNSRSSCYAVRLFIAAATQTVLSLKFMNIIDALGGGQRAWIKLAAILGTIAAIVFAIVYHSRDRNQRRRERRRCSSSCRPESADAQQVLVLCSCNAVLLRSAPGDHTDGRRILCQVYSE